MVEKEKGTMRPVMSPLERPAVSELLLRAREIADIAREVVARLRAQMQQQAQRFRAGRSHVDLAGRIVIIVDEGIATGSTASAACQVARRQGASTVILAAPVGAPESIAALRGVCDEVVCLEAPPLFMAVGTWYDDFSHVPDAEVISLLERGAGKSSERPRYETGIAGGTPGSPGRDKPC